MLLDEILDAKEANISTWLTLHVEVLSTVLNDNSNESYKIEPSTFWWFNLSFEVASSLQIPLISTALLRTRLFVPACKLYNNTSTSVFKQVLGWSALVYKELPKVIYNSFIFCVV